jgi:hypothetical protein
MYVRKEPVLARLSHGPLRMARNHNKQGSKDMRQGQLKKLATKIVGFNDEYLRGTLVRFEKWSGYSGLARVSIVGVEDWRTMREVTVDVHPNDLMETYEK